MSDDRPTASWNARWFDGRSSRVHEVTLRTEGARLRVVDRDGQVLRSFDAADGRPGPHWSRGVLSLTLPDGSSAWIATPPQPPGPGPQAAARRSGVSGSAPSLVERAMASTAAAVAAIVLLVAVLVGMDRVGIGWAARQALVWIPLSVDHALGDKAAQVITSTWLAPPRSTNAQRYTQLQARFAELSARLEPSRPARLAFFRLKSSAGFNAFALPNGDIVVLEGMAEAFTDDEIMAVLGHELGHVVHRHGMQSLFRQIGLLALAQVALSDFSSVLVPVVANLQGLHHSRDAEREADAYARRFCDVAGLPPGTLVSVWQKLARKEAASGLEVPEWMSTHPPTAEREAAARAP